ncbi:MAG: TusE/DsrC/DsvC family sulfur relay protein [Thiotrichaceae bacterium]|nr:TusE/DsrC/DsvC family sulfur relay protein [Thiotrichaceae bacterium]
MAYEVDGKTIEATDSGFLVNIDDWTESVAQFIAKTESIDELTERHWDVIKYLRDEYINNAGNQPNMRNMTKALQKIWNEKKVDTKVIYQLFPGGPSKQAGKIGGLPESRRKGGY